ncbi:amidase signature domain-containing protein [Multifurca ochricompacta]|uniref:Amidase signature domain-containing protein n=1 Tax=Multifurca ochricompacta TaxID=376703 RepID=A0AAD4M7M8_9AGAM|nr:amidase signature domain-containing protein [Multifurca ochricompacta]
MAFVTYAHTHTLTQAYLWLNLKGPKLRAVIETNLLKFHPTGSYAHFGSLPPRIAPVADELCAAGALLLGKANMSEWSNFRGKVPSGFSGRSAIASAIGLAAGAFGTEIDGSIVCPASRNNIVGVKPMVDLTSRAGDTDAAPVLSAIAGRDALDDATMGQPAAVPRFVESLKVQIFVPIFDKAIIVIENLGADIVDPADFPYALRDTEELLVLETEIREGLEQYFSGLLKNPDGIQSLDDLIEFNHA